MKTHRECFILRSDVSFDSLDFKIFFCFYGGIRLYFPVCIFPDLSGSFLRPACTKKKSFHIDFCCFCDIIKEKTKKDEDYGIVTVKKYREIDAK
jgi:hypothetical protein